jgi:hypothetical protein
MRQGLTDRVDLVVMACHRESEQLGLQVREPWRSVGEKHLATANFTDWIDKRVCLSCCGLIPMAESPTLASSVTSALPNSVTSIRTLLTLCARVCDRSLSQGRKIEPATQWLHY